MTDLTKREQYILDRRQEGQPFKEIALDIGMSVGNVALYLRRAQAKLKARSFRGTIRKWQAWKVTNIETYTPPVIKDLRRDASSST